MAKIALAPGLSLPLDAVTETFAILAKRGVGKSYTGMKLAEQMAGAGAQIVVLDPLDAWWGLRSSASGKSDGLAIYQFGGQRGDLPLEASAGSLLADVVVDHGISAIFSTRHLSKTRQRTFVADFAERLYERKGEPEHRTPLHVFIDEADAFVPQRVMGDAARMVGAIDDIVRRGRNAGLGTTLISQRAAVVNWDVLSQCEVLIALRTISKLDRKALENWIEAHDAHDQRQTFMESLATLAVGEAWVWSPGWLDIFQRVKIGQRWTFDSSATPKAGAITQAPKKRATVDLDALKERMADTIEAAEANDPRKLKAEVARLQRELSQRPEAEPEIVEKRVLYVDPTIGTKIEEAAGMLAEIGALLPRAAGALDIAATRVAMTPEPATQSDKPQRPKPFVVPALERATKQFARDVTERVRREVGGTLAKAERSVLSVLAQYPDGLAKGPLTIMSGYAYSGGFRNTLSSLRTAGYIAGGNEAVMKITEEGLQALGPYDPLPAGRDLLRYWLSDSRLAKAEKMILEHLADMYPESYTGEQLAPLVGYEYSGGFRNYLSKLRTLGLIEGSNTAGIAASPVFFP